MVAPTMRLSAVGIDLSPRFFRSAAVVASPALAAETIIASLTVDRELGVTTGIRVEGFAAYTIGAAGVSAVLRLRKTDVSGTVLKSTGAMTIAAAELGSGVVFGLDTAPTLPNQVYVLTLQVASGGAESTVSAVELQALVL